MCHGHFALILKGFDDAAGKRYRQKEGRGRQVWESGGGKQLYARRQIGLVRLVDQMEWLDIRLLALHKNPCRARFLPVPKLCVTLAGGSGKLAA